jgi:hypothetical protein
MTLSLLTGVVQECTHISVSFLTIDCGLTLRASVNNFLELIEAECQGTADAATARQTRKSILTIMKNIDDLSNAIKLNYFTLD